MIQRHDGSGFGESIALNHQESELGEERFQIGRKRRGAHDEAPEFPAEQAMYFAIAPPFARPVHLGRP